MTAVTSRADHWAARFDPLAGGHALGDPLLSRQMRWLPPGTVLQPCPAVRVSQGVVERCGQPDGHPGDKHLAAGMPFEAPELVAGGASR